jgi:hypothetical protein
MNAVNDATLIAKPGLLVLSPEYRRNEVVQPRFRDSDIGLEPFYLVTSETF